MAMDLAFQWQCHPEAARLVGLWVDELVEGIPFLATLQSRMLGLTGTRLTDWIDHLVLPESRVTDEGLRTAGFRLSSDDAVPYPGGTAMLWQHPGGMFPTILTSTGDDVVLTIKVESVGDFLAMNQVHADVDGQPGSPLRIATVSSTAVGRFAVVERHGCRDFFPRDVSPATIVASLRHAERLRRRSRSFQRDADGFAHAAKSFDQVAAELGRDWACDVFFEAERFYWQSRNRAARVQKSRQDLLGLGWANHDHHTYRSSREHFSRLVALLERMGFQCRERFYGGAEAGWGAQVMEQPAAGIVIFADVDLSPEEVTGDFAHQGLPARNELGTVGLWCALHGEAMLQAGLHHLECQFDFDAARSQLAEEGIVTMPKFTDFAFLKQAFTEGEVWQVEEERIVAALRCGAVTEAQAERFRQHGSIGSHLEILQRDDGYKGFNQTGISEIIRETDPRHARETGVV